MNWWRTFEFLLTAADQPYRFCTCTTAFCRFSPIEPFESLKSFEKSTIWALIFAASKSFVFIYLIGRRLKSRRLLPYRRRTNAPQFPECRCNRSVSYPTGVRHGVQKRIAVSLVRNVSEFGFESLKRVSSTPRLSGSTQAGTLHNVRSPRQKCPRSNPPPSGNGGNVSSAELIHRWPTSVDGIAEATFYLWKKKYGHLWRPPKSVSSCRSARRTRA